MIHSPWAVTEAPTLNNSQIILERAVLKVRPKNLGGFLILPTK